MLNFSPRPQSGSSGTLTGASGSFQVPQLQGYYADVTVIANTDSTARTITVTDSNNVQKSTGTNAYQIISKYFIENLDKSRYNTVTIATVPTSWSFDYFIAFHRITGDTRNG